MNIDPAIDPTTINGTTNTDPIATTSDTTDTDDPYTSSYPMPPSPKAEPFIPAFTIPATATTPRDRAYTLHLQGYRSPAIAAHLHVPERTIRHWIQLTNQDLNALPALDDLAALPDATDPDQQPIHPTAPTDANATTPASLTTLQHQRTLAIERHRARSAAAWALHDQLRATLDPFLARLSERLLLHTQYPDDADHVSMSTLELAGGPLSPAFRAMYHMLPGIVNGLTRSLALAERADLQIDRLLAVTPPPAPKQPPESKAVPKQPTQEETKPLPTSADFIRAARAQRIAEEDAYIIPRLTQHERDLIRAYSALPDPLPEGPMETWNIKIDPNAPLTRWREVLLPHNRHLNDLEDDLDADPDPTPPTGTTSTNGTHGKQAGKASSNSGTPAGTRRSPSRPPHHAPTRPTHPSTTTTGGGKEAGKDARTDAPTTSGNPSGNAGNKIGNDSGNTSGNVTAHQPALSSPHSSPRRRTLRRAAPLGAVSTAGRSTAGSQPAATPAATPGNDSGKPSGNHSGNRPNIMSTEHPASAASQSAKHTAPGPSDDAN